MNKQAVIDVIAKELVRFKTIVGGNIQKDIVYHRTAKSIYDRIAHLREFPEEAIKEILQGIKGPGAGVGLHWYTTGGEKALADLKRLWEGTRDNCLYCHQKITSEAPDYECWCHDGIDGCECGYKGSDIKKHRGQHFPEKPKGGCPTCGGSGKVACKDCQERNLLCEHTFTQRACSDCERRKEKRRVDSTPSAFLEGGKGEQRHLLFLLRDNYYTRNRRFHEERRKDTDAK